MAESRESGRRSSDSDDGVSVALGGEMVFQRGGRSDNELGRSEAPGIGSSSNNRVSDSSGTVDRSLPRSNTLPGEAFNIDKLETTPNCLKLEQSKTEKRKKPNILGEEAKQIFDDKISAHKKAFNRSYGSRGIDGTQLLKRI